MDAYILPSGEKISFDDVMNVMLQEDEFPEHYLDTETGAIIPVASAEERKQWAGKTRKTNRYLSIPHVDDENRTSIAYGFVGDTYIGLIPQWQYAQAEKVLGSGGVKEMEKYLRENTDGGIHMWSQHLADEVSEIADDWLTNMPGVPVRIEFEGCGDCAVCELMREKSDPNLSELKHAFDTENTMQSVVSQMEKKDAGDEKPSEKGVK